MLSRIIGLVWCLGFTPYSTEAGSAASFIQTKGADFVLDGSPYKFGGTNCYYLIYKDDVMIDDVLDTMQKSNFQVLRTWAFLDMGRADGSGSIDKDGRKDGVAFQYWDDAAGKPLYNDSSLVHLDNVLAKASKRNVRVILTLTNNWGDFGGMDQYVRWREWQDPTYKGHHDDFYNDTTIVQWYKDYAAHLIHRTNTVTGKKYRDDPTIFAWELANEPRCRGSGVYGGTGDCVRRGEQPEAWKITEWIKDVSAYIKAQDPNHMVAVGDEGFWCQKDCGHEWCDCSDGVDSRNFTAISTIDFMSLHMYPDHWGADANSWAEQWIREHASVAHELGKPAVLGEYGWQNSQHQTYKRWTDIILDSGMNGDLFWMISGLNDVPCDDVGPDSNTCEDQKGWGKCNESWMKGYCCQTCFDCKPGCGGGDGKWVPNYDGYGVYCDPSGPGKDPESCNVLAQHATAMSGAAPPSPTPPSPPPTPPTPVPPTPPAPPSPPPAPPPTPPAPAPPPCPDVAPDTTYTCEQQRGWGKCGESFMIGYCCSTCFACDGKCGSGSGCPDVAPDSSYTCDQQKSWGKCNETWMVGYCCNSCFGCQKGCGAASAEAMVV